MAPDENEFDTPDLDDIMLSETESEKDKCSIISLSCGI